MIKFKKNKQISINNNYFSKSLFCYLKFSYYGSFILIINYIGLTLADPIRCDVFDLGCRQQQSFFQQQNSRLRPCNYQDIWLIPGRADASCSRNNAKKLIDINPRHISIKPAVIKFPGCFTVEIKNVHITDTSDILRNSLFAKTEYQWLNIKEFGQTKCQNSTNNGCGGYGNNCYYCDICENLKNIDLSNSTSNSFFSQQFRNLNCPKRPGYYTFRKEFCFNDWSAFDTDGDCRLDFIDSDKSNLKAAFTSLQQIGYGTIVAKIHLAYNATTTIQNKKMAKEEQIKETVMNELEERRQNWDINKGQFEKFQQWYIDYRKNIWHREEYLPWLLYENEISCLRLTFDVCERLPRQRGFGAHGYTCD